MAFIQSYGMQVMGGFILGFDTDREDTWFLSSVSPSVPLSSPKQANDPALRTGRFGEAIGIPMKFQNKMIG